MARNKKLGKAVRERMARTGENYTTARTRLLSEEPPRELFSVRSVVDLDPGAGELAQPWRTLRVRYAVGADERWTEKVFALRPGSGSWMGSLVGMRVGGTRRIEGEYASRAIELRGRCVIEATLVEIGPYVPEPPQELVVGVGPTVRPGDRVRVGYTVRLRDVTGTKVGGSGAAGVWVTLGAGELEPDVERIVLGMREGGARTAVLASESSAERWVWVELLERWG